MHPTNICPCNQPKYFSTFVLFLCRPIFVLIPHLSYINTGLLVAATGATAPNQYLHSGHRYSQANSSLDIFTIANRESPQSHRNALHKYSNPPESNMDLDLSKTLICLQRTLFTFLNISNIGSQEIYSLSATTFPSLYKKPSVALTQD